MITHFTVNTGDKSLIRTGDVSAGAVQVLRDWIPSAIKAGTSALPVADLSHFSATVFGVGTGLVMTVNAPAAPHVPGRPQKGCARMPLVTFGVGLMQPAQGRFGRRLGEPTRRLG